MRKVRAVGPKLSVNWERVKRAIRPPELDISLTPAQIAYRTAVMSEDHIKRLRRPKISGRIIEIQDPGNWPCAYS